MLYLNNKLPTNFNFPKGSWKMKICRSPSPYICSLIPFSFSTFSTPYLLLNHTTIAIFPHLGTSPYSQMIMIEHINTYLSLLPFQHILSINLQIISELDLYILQFSSKFMSSNKPFFMLLGLCQRDLLSIPVLFTMVLPNRKQEKMCNHATGVLAFPYSTKQQYFFLSLLSSLPVW